MEIKRILLFLLGCIGVRLLFVYLSKTYTDKLYFFGIIASIIALGFFYVYFIGSDKADKQLEWLGDKQIWWDQLRIVHGLLFTLFAIFAFQKKSYSWVVLLIDTMIGLSAWIIHHSSGFNFN
jgi:hypothetical protein